jgi:hypothetical protein
MKMDKSPRKLYSRRRSLMKRLALFFLAILGILPLIRGEQSPSASPRANASDALLSRGAVVPLTAVARFFPEVTQETSTGENATAVGKPKATRSVIYTTADESKKVTITVDRYASPGDASAAYEHAVQKSRIVPGFKSLDAANLDHQTFMGTVTQGTETHIGLGTLRGTLIVGVTLVGYEPNPDTMANLVALTREEEKAADASVTSIPRGARDKDRRPR